MSFDIILQIIPIQILNVLLIITNYIFVMINFFLPKSATFNSNLIVYLKIWHLNFKFILINFTKGIKKNTNIHNYVKILIENPRKA